MILVGISIGSVAGGSFICCIMVFFYKKKRNKKEEKIFADLENKSSDIL